MFGNFSLNATTVAGVFKFHSVGFCFQSWFFSFQCKVFTFLSDIYKMFKISIYRPSKTKVGIIIQNSDL